MFPSFSSSQISVSERVSLCSCIFIDKFVFEIKYFGRNGETKARRNFLPERRMQEQGLLGTSGKVRLWSALKKERGENGARKIPPSEKRKQTLEKISGHKRTVKKRQEKILGEGSSGCFE